VRLLREQHARDVWFLGKTLVASAGFTIMGAFPHEKRWLLRDAALLIHGRRMTKDLHLEGPLGSCRRVLEEMIADIDQGLRLEEQRFFELIEGSSVAPEEIARRAYSRAENRQSPAADRPMCCRAAGSLADPSDRPA
jgi:hypothetical protein